MKKLKVIIGFLLLIGLLAACSSNDESEETDSLEDELPTLDVDFKVPETADLNETVNLTALVTYDDHPEENAEVVFEIWESGKEDDSEMLDGENEGDGNYTLDYTFDNEAVYEMYAHTDAEGLHTMPKKEIVVGNASAEKVSDDHQSSYHAEGFDMHFNQPEDVSQNDITNLETHIMLDEEPLENLDVRYEIVLENNPDNTEWIDASKGNPGEYTAEYDFPDKGNYTVVVHVEDDKDLHEHNEYEINVN